MSDRHDLLISQWDGLTAELIDLYKAQGRSWANVYENLEDTTGRCSKTTVT